MENNLNQNVDTLFSNLENFTQNEGLIGKAITYENKTFIPVVSVTLGYGSGNTASKAQTGQSSSPISGLGNMSGGALGLGAKLATDAVIVIEKDKNSMTMMPINTTTANASQLMDKIPQMFTGMNQNQQQNQQQNTQQGKQNQGQNKQ